MSNRGTRVPTTLYWLTALSGAGFAFATPVPEPDRPATVVLNSLPPSRSPYLTDLPPPDTTPSVTLRLPTGTPSWGEGRPSSARRASAAACRRGGPPRAVPLLPVFAPRFGNGWA